MSPEVILLFVAPDGAKHWLFADTQKADVLAHDDYVHLCRLAARTGTPIIGDTPSTFIDLVQSIGSVFIAIEDVTLTICEIGIHIAQKRGACAEALFMMRILVFGCLGIVINETSFDTLTLCAQRSDDYETQSRHGLEGIRAARSGILTLDPRVWHLQHGAHFYRPGFSASTAPQCLWKTELVSGIRNTDDRAVAEDFERRSPEARYLFYESVLLAFGTPFSVAAGSMLPIPHNLPRFLPPDLVPPPEPLIADIPPMQLDEQFMQAAYSEPMDLLQDMDMITDEIDRLPLQESYSIPMRGNESPHDATNDMLLDVEF